MARVYAALRPQNLRTVTGPTTFVRGADIPFAFELVNTTTAAVSVPISNSTVGQGRWLGVVQTWIEPLAAGVSLTGCAPQLSQQGARLAAGGRVLAFVSHAAGQPFAAGDGLTERTQLQGQLTACFPAGQYRYHVEYRAMDSAADDVIAATSLDLMLREPDRWAVGVSAGTATGTATLERTADGRSVTSRVVVTGLVAGAAVGVVVRTGTCAGEGALVVPPAFIVAGGSGTDRLSETAALSAAAGRAIATRIGVSIWVTSGMATRCAPYAPTPLPVATGRGPTTWGGPLLREAVAGGGLTVTASSEIPGGRASLAVDGRTDDAWNSGGSVPGWIEIDLGRDTLVTGVSMMPSQLPNVAATFNRVYGRASGGRTEVLLHESSGVTHDGTWTEVTFEKAQRVRYVRVETVASPSWVAWREIAILGPTLPKPSILPVGTHDGAIGSTVSGDQCYANGWAFDRDDETRDVTVRVLVDGKTAWEGVASQSRPDVRNAGFGDGTSGFWVVLRGLVTTGVPHAVRVQAKDEETGRWIDLNGTPRTLTCL